VSAFARSDILPAASSSALASALGYITGSGPGSLTRVPTDWWPATPAGSWSAAASRTVR
jgi:hypothetical protein